MTEPIYVSQEELEAEEARITELKLEIPQRREAIEELDPQIEALLKKIPERRTEIERLRRSIRTHRGWVTRRSKALSEYMGILSALGRNPDFLTRMALWGRKTVVARRLKEGSPAKTRADIDAREKEITRLWGRIGGLTSSLHAQESELRSLRGRRAALIRWIRERETELAYEQERLTRKVVKPPVKLVRIKIRLYNVIEGPSGSPVGMFQGWLDIDVILDEHGEPDWGWWLTVEEIRAAKYHFCQYFKGLTRHYNPKLNEWKGFITDIEGQVRLTQFPNADGIPYGNETVKYHRYGNGSPAVKRIPASFVRMAENMTVNDLVVGESSKTPEPVDEPQGVFFQQVLILGVDGTIKWQERRDKWCWRLPESYIERVKEELGLE